MGADPRSDELRNVLQYFFGFVCNAQNGSKDSCDVNIQEQNVHTFCEA
jgi:hypothetical protein